MNLEKQLEAALQKGDRHKLEKVFSDIYSAYFRLACYVASNYLKTKEDIEDAANDAFINFFNHLEGFDASRSIKYYITTSARNIAINIGKKNQEQLEFDEDVSPSSDKMPQETMLIDVMEKTLTKEEISLINEHVIDGVSLKEIADRRSESPNTVKSKYLRAIKKLRAELRKGG